MARMARVVGPGFPHHIVQRGNRRQKVFFNDQDKMEYLRILKEESERFGVEYWAYCLMDNHVHFVAVPQRPESLAKAIGETHRRYTRMVNFREGWRGYLWQGRFSSYILDEAYVFNAIRYVERNPVRAGIVKEAEEYRWSSARAHAQREKDELLRECYLMEQVKDWRGYLKENDGQEGLLCRHLSTGRPLGKEYFIQELEAKLGIMLRKQKPGPRPKGN